VNAVIENLTFNVAQLLKEPIGAVRAGQVAADVRRLAPELAQAASTVELALTGPVRLTHTDGGVLVQGALTSQAVLPCSRCLEPVALTLEIELEEIFAQTVDVLTGQAITLEEDDRALWIDDRHLLDLGEVLRQNALVAAPMHPLCRPDCRGLCAICGQNLNEETCTCEAEPDARWAILATLLQNSES
jgi:uncharacterized protein